MTEPEYEGWSDPEDLETGAEDEPEAVEYDEDTTALLVQAREEERAKLQAEFADDKAKRDRRFNRTIEALRAEGRDIAEDGTPLVRDAQAALAWAKQNVVPLAMGEQAPAAEERIVLTPYDDEETLTAKSEAIADRRATKAVEAATRPLMERLDALMGLVGQQAQGGTLEHARTALDGLGLGPLADDPTFQQHYREAVNNAVTAYGPGALTDPATLRAAAGLACFTMPQEPVQKARAAGMPTGDPVRDRLIAAQRAGVRQTAPSRGMGAADYSDTDVMGAQLLGVSVAEYRRLGEDNSVDDTLARRRGKNGAAR